jgi:hypothetical protein
LDDYITFAATSAVTQNQGVIMKVAAIDPILGVIQLLEVSGSSANLNAATAAYWIFPYGDAYYNNADSAGSFKKLDGMQRWIPTTKPTTGDSFNGVDRSVSNRLYGKYFDFSSASRESALLRGSTILAKEGGAPSVCVVPYTQARALNEELGLRKEFVDMNPVTERGLLANIAFKAIVVHGPGVVMRVLAAMRAPADEALVIEPDDFALKTAGPMLNMEDYDGLVVMRHPTEDSYEGRMVFRGNLICRKPGKQGRIKLQAAA